MAYIKDYIAVNEPKMMEDLFSLIRIPSISALPEHHRHTFLQMIPARFSSSNPSDN